MENLIGADFRGCVLLAQGGRILFEKAFGFADLPNRIPNGIDTRFATASAGKVFVAVGILQLMEKGLLRLDDRIEDILDLDLKAIDGTICIEELLSHTSGIPDYFDESVMREYEELWADFPNYKIRSNKDLLPLFIDKPMLYPRGTRFQYNNTGYVVLAMVIEAITGMEFDRYLKENVFAPCGMHSTGYYELDRLPAHCAAHYIYKSDTDYRTNIFSVDAKGTGAGGAFTTVHDIRRFWEHLMAHRLLTAETTAAMLADHSGARCYGYGVWLAETGGRTVPYFEGCDPGVSFISCYDREKDGLAVLVSNYGDDVWALLKRLKAADMDG